MKDQWGFYFSASSALEKNLNWPQFSCGLPLTLPFSIIRQIVVVVVGCWPRGGLTNTNTESMVTGTLLISVPVVPKILH